MGTSSAPQAEETLPPSRLAMHAEELVPQARGGELLSPALPRPARRDRGPCPSKWEVFGPELRYMSVAGRRAHGASMGTVFDRENSIDGLITAGSVCDAEDGRARRNPILVVEAEHVRERERPLNFKPVWVAMSVHWQRQRSHPNAAQPCSPDGKRCILRGCPGLAFCMDSMCDAQWTAAKKGSCQSGRREARPQQNAVAIPLATIPRLPREGVGFDARRG
ncbi:hypothetical protein AURDEDRAFT_117824 [Auricularia subglabra TFB-10046 SS5]|uniref:Uncharacterized protein n=1 Tax=Auricularia subglabra (strain TFB-10046 / SS5) TaxID=717982 RepID=J0D4R9_AURST|nr:hypothetical protein AURDEDRAFT_117824 [Auricularia subglabra TFB-10046 SS5]